MISMRIWVAAAVVAMVLLIDFHGPAQAAPWCAWYTGNDYSSDCSFYTLQQCAVTVRGVGGYCAPNAYAAPLPYPPPPYRKRPPRRHYY